MKSIVLFSLLLVTVSGAYAGDSGVTLTTCVSESLRTTLIYRTDDFANDINAEVFLGIDGSMYVTKNSKVCLNDTDLECEFVQFGTASNTLMTGAEETQNIIVEFSGADRKKAVLKKGFADPRNYKPFQSDIYLNCTYNFENP